MSRVDGDTPGHGGGNVSPEPGSTDSEGKGVYGRPSEVTSEAVRAPSGYHIPLGVVHLMVRVKELCGLDYAKAMIRAYGGADRLLDVPAQATFALEKEALSSLRAMGLSEKQILDCMRFGPALGKPGGQQPDVKKKPSRAAIVLQKREQLEALELEIYHTVLRRTLPGVGRR